MPDRDPPLPLDSDTIALSNLPARSTSPTNMTESEDDEWVFGGDWTLSEEAAEKKEKIRTTSQLFDDCNSWESVLETFRQADLELPQHILDMSTWSNTPWEDTRAIREAFTLRVPYAPTIVFLWNTVFASFAQAELAVPEGLTNLQKWCEFPWLNVKYIWEALWEAEDKYNAAQQALTLAHAEPPPFSKFTCFRKLPTEIRLKIWALNLPGPRLVVVRYDWWDRGDFTSLTPVPVNLHVDAESRHEALKVYKLCFEACRPGHREYDNDFEDESDVLVYHRPPKIYFNFELDTVIFARQYHDWFVTKNSVGAFTFLIDKDCHSIENMMIMLPLGITSINPDQLFDRSISLLRSLKKITILFAESFTRHSATLNDSPVEVLAIGDRNLDPYEYYDFADPLFNQYTAAQCKIGFNVVPAQVEEYFRQHASAAGWTRIPDVVIAKPKPAYQIVRSVLNLCF